MSSSFALEANGKFEQKPAHSGAINILVENQNKAEKQAIEAALKALMQVYQIEIFIDFEKALGKKYDLALPIGEGWVGFFSGQLPEYLGEKLIKHYQLKTVQKPLSQQQLNSLFKISQNHSKITEESGFSKAILLLFIIILGIERWIALKKNA